MVFQKLFTLKNTFRKQDAHWGTEKRIKHKRNLGEPHAASLTDCATEEAGIVCFITRGLCHLDSFLISGCTIIHLFIFFPMPTGRFAGSGLTHQCEG